MANIPAKVFARLTAGLKKFQPILARAKSRDVNESDTVILITDTLSEVFGYDKYSQITSELAIQGTYCDLAIKLDGKVTVLIEAKAIGHELKDQHVKQAVDYAANQGVEWVVLTNSIKWRIYKVVFAKPINAELLAELDFLSIDPKDEAALNLLFLLTLEGWTKSAIGEYSAQRQALSRFCLGALILSDAVLSVMRRELRRISPDVKIDTEEIEAALRDEVIKREVIEGEKYIEAKKMLTRASTRHLRETKDESIGEPTGTPAEIPAVPPEPGQ